MKTSLRTILLGTAVFLICGAPSSISFDALYPAEVGIPAEIKTLGLIDRSQTQDKKMNTIEAGLTGEGLRQDKLASQICLDGLYERLNNSRRFTAVRTLKQYKNSGKGVEFPEPLGWDEIEALCKEFGTDGIVSLEIFDSDFLVDYAQVKVGFRFYDPATRTVIDEVRYSQKMKWNPPALNVDAVIGRLMEKNDAIRDASYQSGHNYGQRISPTWFRVTRIYYKRGKRNEDLKVGARMMEVNDWNAAIESLTSAMNDRHRKVRGRASHNLAVVYEILGDYPQAKKWAQDAWGKYRNKDSKDYSYSLGQRIDEFNLLQQQMDGGD